MIRAWLFVPLFLLFATTTHAVPVSYSFTGVVSSFNDNCDDPDYARPPITTGESVSGTITWDSDRTPEDNETYYTVSTDFTFMDFNVGDIHYTIDYASYDVRFSDNGTYATVNIDNLGSDHSYSYEDKTYQVDAPTFKFFSAPGEFSDSVYQPIDFSKFTSADLSIPTIASIDTVDGDTHHYQSRMKINVNDFAPIPEPGTFILLGCGVLLGVLKKRSKV